MVCKYTLGGYHNFDLATTSASLVFVALLEV